MKTVEIRFMFQRTSNRYAQELSIWTMETNYLYYPLSYSLRECLELICEKLNWKYVQYGILDSFNGRLYAMEPEPKKVTTSVKQCYGTELTGVSPTDGVRNIYWHAEG